MYKHNQTSKQLSTVPSPSPLRAVEGGQLLDHALHQLAESVDEEREVLQHVQYPPHHQLCLPFQQHAVLVSWRGGVDDREELFKG